MTTLLLALPLLFAPQPAPMSASATKVTPKAVAEFEMSKLKGVIRRLAWNADNTQLYLQTAELGSDAQPKALHHYLIDPATGATKNADDEPAWAATYWAWKSWKAAPDDEKFVIEVSEEQRKNAATAIPMGGDYARGGSGADVSGAAGSASAESVMAAAQQSQVGTARIMKLKGQNVGEWMNQPIVPGQSFGWGPKGTSLIAYAEPNNRALMIMDKTGAKQKIDDTRGVYSPSFSNDSRKLTWLEVRGKKAVLVVADVAAK
ncbi:MAG: hypothetical protein EPO35_09800 [Acidobacteria bacterium]|nr:MAG: hypothetical protein EPO35_09800 [Acidobacteriota bacterium]